MAIKSILSITNGLDSELGALYAALMVGQAHGAHIRFVSIAFDPYNFVDPEDQAFSRDIIQNLQEENEEHHRRTFSQVKKLCEVYNIPFENEKTDGHQVSANYRRREGALAPIISEEGRLSDLIVLGRGIAETNVHYQATMLAALFNTGRPLLLVPTTKNTKKLSWNDKKVVVAWNGCLEASRACYQAMPILKNAEDVIILQAHYPKREAEIISAAHLKTYLEYHNVKLSEIIAVNAAHRSLGEALIDKAIELKSDLLISGAYGHNRFSEMLLGGVTNDLLEKATMPILLSH